MHEVSSDDCLAISTLKPQWTPNETARLLAVPAVRGFMADDGQGFVLFFDSGDEAEIIEIAVAQDSRQRGIGRSLMQAAMSGKASVFLDVQHDNAAALALYKSLGFRVVGRREKYYNNKGDALTMVYKERQ